MFFVCGSYGLALVRAPSGRGCRKPSLGASAGLSALRASILTPLALRAGALRLLGWISSSRLFTVSSAVLDIKTGWTENPRQVGRDECEAWMPGEDVISALRDPLPIFALTGGRARRERTSRA